MRMRGTIIYCNNCGLKIFLRGDYIPAYKAYPSAPYWKDIDHLPEGWVQIENEHLCPECSNKWKLSVSRINDIAEELLRNPMIPRTLVHKMLNSIKTEE